MRASIQSLARSAFAALALIIATPAIVGADVGPVEAAAPESHHVTGSDWRGPPPPGSAWGRTQPGDAGSSSLAARERPTPRMLLMQCENRANTCVFHPRGPLRKRLGPRKRVSSTSVNCSSRVQRYSKSWTHTVGTSYTVGLETDAGVGIEEMSFAIKASYSKTWQRSTSVTDSQNVDVPPHGVGFISRAALRQRVHGTWEILLQDSYFGHYVWYIRHFRASGPVGKRGAIIVKAHKMKPKRYNRVCD